MESVAKETANAMEGAQAPARRIRRHPRSPPPNSPTHWTCILEAGKMGGNGGNWGVINTIMENVGTTSRVGEKWETTVRITHS